MYLKGQAVKQNYQKAFIWIQKVAKQGFPQAQALLGTLYSGGLGVKQNYKKAFVWTQKAAEQGFPLAQYNLGIMYHNGHGVKQDMQKASIWTEKAAKQGDANAQKYLSDMSSQSQVTSQNDQQAVKVAESFSEIQKLLQALFYLACVVALIVVIILFHVSLYKTMKKVPKDKRLFPAWFVWMMLIPVAGLVFACMMLPWGVPKSIGRAVIGNAKAGKSARSLFGLGLTCVILLTIINIISILEIPLLGTLLGIATLIMLIIYWVKVVKFRKVYLIKGEESDRDIGSRC